jgi:hypothetical protein
MRRGGSTAACIENTSVAQDQNVECFLLPVGIVTEVEREMARLAGFSFDGGDFLVQQVFERPRHILPHGVLVGFGEVIVDFQAPIKICP